MSGVRTGTRLEQLERLHGQTSHELAAARRREEWRAVARLELLRDRLAEEISKVEPTAAPAARTVRSPSGPSRELQLLADLGVTARDVKFWAVEQGLLEKVSRGRVKLDLVEKYSEALRCRPA